MQQRTEHGAAADAVDAVMRRQGGIQHLVLNVCQRGRQTGMGGAQGLLPAGRTISSAYMRQ